MNSSKPAVLILTHHADFYTVDRVAEAVARRGLRPVRFDTDRFPARATLSASVDHGTDGLLLRDGDQAVRGNEVRAMWMRHVRKPAPAPDLDPRFHDGAVRESSEALYAAFDLLRDARWIDSPAVVARARNKLLQLRLAREAGLAIPRTILTNDPAEARAFHAAVEGRAVAKMLTPLHQSMDASGPFVYTSRVRESDLAEADTLRHAPMLFQEEIEKSRELRVAIVDGELFAGAIEASGSPAGAVDWRRSDPADCRWERDTLPADCAASLRMLMASLGLAFGAVDLIRTPEGRHVFLEVNPNGEWGMLERDLGHPIAEALARSLCGE